MATNDNAMESGDAHGTASNVEAASTDRIVSPRPAWRRALPMAAVIVFSMVLRFGIASLPLERDEGEYAYIAQRWLAGDVPYRDAFNQKTPGVFVAYAALFATGLRSVEAIHWLAHAALIGTILLMYRLGKLVHSREMGWIAALFTVVLALDSNMLGNAANTEAFAILPITGCIYCAARAAARGRTRDIILTGVCAGVALSCKQVVLPIVLFSFGWVLYYRWAGPVDADRRSAAAEGTDSGAAPLTAGVLLLVGLAVVLLPMCGYFAMNGAWSAFIDCVAGHNLAYATRLPLRYYGSNFWDNSRFIYVIFAPIFLAAIIALVAAYLRGFPGVRLGIGWGLASFLAVSVGGYYRPHYFILLTPPLALIAAYGIVALASVLEPSREVPQRWIATVFAIGSIVWPIYFHRYYYWTDSLDFLSRQLYRSNPFPESAALGKLIRENSAPTDRVFICGSEPQILFHAQRASASRYVFLYPLFSSSESITRQREVIEELRSRPPKWLVVVDPTVVPFSYSMSADTPPYFFEELFELVRGNYVPFAASTLGIDGTTRLVRPILNDDGELEFLHAEREVVTIRMFKRRDEDDSGESKNQAESGMPSVQSQLRQNLDRVQRAIERAAQRSGRTADSVRLVAITKTVDIATVAELVALHVEDFGESRPQELWRKRDGIADPVRWHLVGSLQKNKARRTLPMVQLIHSVDSFDLLARLDELGRELELRPRVLLEVNVSGESAKHGFRPDQVPQVVAEIANLARVEIGGLMTMAPLADNPEHARPHFAQLRRLRDNVAPSMPPQHQFHELSMGMSNDFEVAIEEGATIVRVGSALFRGIEGPA